MSGGIVSLREPASHDLDPLVDVLSMPDATHFGIDDCVTELAVRQFIDRSLRDRLAGVSFTYLIALTSSRATVGLVQVRQLDPGFEIAECECTIVPSSRGTGLFLEAAKLVGSFAFRTVGVHRLETRVSRQNGRANGALRKLGAVHEGVLRQSARQNGRFVDQMLWSMLKDEWADHWVSAAPRVH